MLIRIKKLKGYGMWRVINNMEERTGRQFDDLLIGKEYPCIPHLDGEDASAPYYNVKGYLIHPDDIEIVDWE